MTDGLAEGFRWSEPDEYGRVHLIYRGHECHGSQVLWDDYMGQALVLRAHGAGATAGTLLPSTFKGRVTRIVGGVDPVKLQVEFDGPHGPGGLMFCRATAHGRLAAFVQEHERDVTEAEVVLEEVGDTQAKRYRAVRLIVGGPPEFWIAEDGYGIPDAVGELPQAKAWQDVAQMVFGSRVGEAAKVLARVVPGVGPASREGGRSADQIVSVEPTEAEVAEHGRQFQIQPGPLRRRLAGELVATGSGVRTVESVGSGCIAEPEVCAPGVPTVEWRTVAQLDGGVYLDACDLCGAAVAYSVSGWGSDWRAKHVEYHAKRGDL